MLNRFNRCISSYALAEGPLLEIYDNLVAFFSRSCKWPNPPCSRICSSMENAQSLVQLISLSMTKKVQLNSSICMETHMQIRVSTTFARVDLCNDSQTGCTADSLSQGAAGGRPVSDAASCSRILQVLLKPVANS